MEKYRLVECQQNWLRCRSVDCRLLLSNLDKSYSSRTTDGNTIPNVSPVAVVMSSPSHWKIICLLMLACWLLYLALLQ